MGEALIGHIVYDAAYEPYPWVYSVDYATPDGKRDLDRDSFDYGNVETREFAERCVADAIERHARGEQG